MKPLTLNLPMMYGDHHVMEVRGILGALPGIGHVRASAAWQQVALEYDEGQIDPAAIVQALQARGYTPNEPGSILISARTKRLTGFASGPGGVEQFVERVPSAGMSSSGGACPGFEIRQPGDVHPADR